MSKLERKRNDETYKTKPKQRSEQISVADENTNRIDNTKTGGQKDMDRAREMTVWFPTVGTSF